MKRWNRLIFSNNYGSRFCEGDTRLKGQGKASYATQSNQQAVVSGMVDFQARVSLHQLFSLIEGSNRVVAVGVARKAAHLP